MNLEPTTDLQHPWSQEIPLLNPQEQFFLTPVGWDI